MQTLKYFVNKTKLNNLIIEHSINIVESTLNYLVIVLQNITISIFHIIYP